MDSDTGEPTYGLLLIEDNRGDARLIREMLKSSPWGAVVDHAETLEEGLTRAAEGHHDLAFVDLSLPDSHGLETLCAVRDRCPDLPLIVLTGLDHEAVGRQAVAQGAQDYLVKGSFHDGSLQRAARYAIERHRMEKRRLALEHEVAQHHKLQAIGELAAGIAHEINTPTQYVSDNTRFLRESVLDLLAAIDAITAVAAAGDVARAEIDSILAKADLDYLRDEIPRSLTQSLEGLEHIARIVGAMKDFSHPSNDEKAPVNLNHALKNTIVVSANEWKCVADVETDLAPDLPEVTCLPGQMNQVFLNLIVNAAHAITDGLAPGSSEKGKITVSTAHPGGDHIEIRIADTGCGIPAEHAARIFEPFFTTKEVGRGTGQGLAIARDLIVNKHGGTIEVDSEPGAGTCFTLRLPIEPEAAPAGADAMVQV